MLVFVHNIPTPSLALLETSNINALFLQPQTSVYARKYQLACSLSIYGNPPLHKQTHSEMLPFDKALRPCPSRSGWWGAGPLDISAGIPLAPCSQGVLHSAALWQICTHRKTSDSNPSCRKTCGLPATLTTQHTAHSNPHSTRKSLL
jgi:hypothetical protein